MIAEREKERDRERQRETENKKRKERETFLILFKVSHKYDIVLVNTSSQISCII